MCHHGHGLLVSRRHLVVFAPFSEVGAKLEQNERDRNQGQSNEAKNCERPTAAEIREILQDNERYESSEDKTRDGHNRESRECARREERVEDVGDERNLKRNQQMPTERP